MARDSRKKEPPKNTIPDPASDEMVVFMNAIARNSRVKGRGEWMRGFCMALKELFGDVDTIGIELNMSCDLADIEGPIVNGHRYSQLNARLIGAVVCYITHEFSLDPTDSPVILLWLLGCTYKEIAAKLFLSTHAIAKRIKKIYKVTGSSNLLELYWRHLQKEVGDVDELEKREREEERPVIVF